MRLKKDTPQPFSRELWVALIRAPWPQAATLGGPGFVIRTIHHVQSEVVSKDKTQMWEKEDLC